MRHANLTTTRRHHLLTGATAAALTLVMSACGAITEKITEEGAERIIEAETGENIELDIGGDGISVQSDDGSFSLNEDGEFVVTDADGSVFRGSASDDGLTVTDANGEQVIDVDANGDTGEITIQGEDGESVYRVVEDIPDEWPSDIPRPDGLDVQGGTYARDGESVLITLFAESSGGPQFAENYAALLTASGFEQTGDFSSSSDGATTAQRTLENDRWVVNVNGFDDGTGFQSVQLSITNQN